MSRPRIEIRETGRGDPDGEALRRAMEAEMEQRYADRLAELVEYYRERWEFHGHDPKGALVGAGSAANYHVEPSAVLEAVEAYREAFKPSAVLAAPHVMVSADVVVAPDDETARRIASPYGLWVLSVRDGRGAIPFPTEEDAAAHVWTDEDRALVADRVDTQFVGSPRTVADRLRTLRRVTGADELLVTTIVHDHADRLRSFELLAEEWNIPR